MSTHNFSEVPAGVSAAFKAGWEGFFNYQQLADNPHIEDNEQRRDWVNGFEDAARNSLVFKSPDGSSQIVRLDKLVLNEHTCSQEGTFYFFKAMGDFEDDPYNAGRISQTTLEVFNRYKRLYPSAPVTVTSSD